MTDEPSVAPVTRNTFNLTAVQLADCLLPFAKANGPSFLKYKDESEKCNDAKVVHGPGGIDGAKEWLQAVHALNSSMQPPCKSLAVKALKIIYNELKDDDKWLQLKPADLGDWEETLSRRLRNPMRVVAQAARKPKPPQWLLDVIPQGEPVLDDRDPLGEIFAEAEETQKDDLEEELFGSEPMDPFEYGLNDELMLPFRKRKGTDLYETGLPIKVNADARPEDQVVGKFTDGTEHTIGITNEEWALKWPTTTGQVKHQDLYETEHKGTKHKISIKQRPDRAFILMSIYEQGRQVLQVRQCLFGEAGSEVMPIDHPTVVETLKFMVPLADMYAQGDLTVPGLKEERDKRLRDQGIATRARKGASPEDPSMPIETKKARRGKDTSGLQAEPPKEIVDAKPPKAEPPKEIVQAEPPKAKKRTWKPVEEASSSAASASSSDPFGFATMPCDTMSLAKKLFMAPKQAGGDSAAGA
jgi:hypothetical protein